MLVPCIPDTLQTPFPASEQRGLRGKAASCLLLTGHLKSLCSKTFLGQNSH